MTSITTVGDDFPKQQARVRVIQQHARECSPGGAFLVMMCEQALREAEEAAISGDPVAVLRAYANLMCYTTTPTRVAHSQKRRQCNIALDDMASDEAGCFEFSLGEFSRGCCCPHGSCTCGRKGGV